MCGGGGGREQPAITNCESGILEMKQECLCTHDAVSICHPMWYCGSVMGVI